MPPFEAISSWVEFIKPEMKNALLTELPKMLAEKYKDLILKDQKISEDQAARLIPGNQRQLKQILRLAQANDPIAPNIHL